MNNTFNLNRFWLLFKKHTIEHGKANLLSIGVLIGIFFIVMAFYAIVDHGLSLKVQTVIFSVSLVITGGIFTSMIFISLSDKKKAIAELTLPVSNFEKYLVAWLYSYPIFLMIFIIAFYFTAGVIQNITPDRLGYPKDVLINIFNTEQDVVKMLFVFAVLHGLTFWGAIFFKTLHFIKTAFVFFISLITLIVINKMVIALFIANNRLSNTLPFSPVSFFYAQDKFVRIDVSGVYNIVGGVIVVTIVLLLWTSAFFKLKEKEV